MWTSVGHAYLNVKYLSIIAFMYKQKFDKTGRLTLRYGFNGEYKIFNIFVHLYLIMLY